MGLKEDIDGYEFEVNEWGSVQYAGALRAFKVFVERAEAKGLEATVKEFEGLGLRVHMDKKDKAQAIADVKKALLADIEEYYGSFEMDAEDKERKAKFEDELRAMTRLDESFDICKRMAWDLWAAAAFIAKACGIRLEDVPASRGIGPSMNVAAQGENLSTGLYCAILRAKGLVEDDKAFADFDT
jgi:hypothetical protein